MPVYFVGRSDNTGDIKIGFSKHPQNRLSQIQRMSPSSLKLYGTFDGDEGDIHKYFSDIRTHGEWFKRCDRLLEFIENPFHPKIEEENNIRIIRAEETKFVQDVVRHLYADYLECCNNCGAKFQVIGRQDKRWRGLNKEYYFKIYGKEENDQSTPYCPLCGTKR